MTLENQKFYRHRRKKIQLFDKFLTGHIWNI